MTSEQDDRIMLTFATPVARRLWPDAGPVNEGLERLILEKERTEAGLRRSNGGGWRSEPSLLRWGGPEIEALGGWITETVRQMTRATSQSAGEFTGKMHVDGWANVLRRGGYNKIHSHPGHAWSGVYYVAVGASDPDTPDSGVIEFLDPRVGADMIPIPGSPFGGKLRVEPEPGLMLLFPSWLYHYVNPYQGPDARISISFNLRIVEFSPQAGNGEA